VAALSVSVLSVEVVSVAAISDVVVSLGVVCESTCVSAVPDEGCVESVDSITVEPAESPSKLGLGSAVVVPGRLTVEPLELVVSVVLITGGGCNTLSVASE